MTSQPRSFLDDDGSPPVEPGKVVCPKCGMKQPLTLDCVNCGAIIDPPQAVAAARPGAAGPASAPSAALRSGREPGSAAPAAPGEVGDAGEGAPGDIYQGDDVYQGDVYQGEDSLATGAAAAPGLYRGVPRRAFTPPPLTAFSIFGETFSIFSRHFVGFLIIAGVVLLPSIVFAFHTSGKLSDLGMSANPTPAELFSTMRLVGASVLLMMLCAPAATAAVTYGVARELRRKSATMLDCVKTGVAVLVPTVLVIILQTILITLVALLLFVPGIFVLAIFVGLLGHGNPIGSSIVFAAGLIVLSLFVMKFAACYAVTVPATVEERPGVFGALSRSWDLTRGARWMIVRFFLLLSLVGVAIFGIQLLVAMVSSANTAEIVAQLGSILTTAIHATGAAVIYYRLRSIDERVPVEELSTVFD